MEVPDPREGNEYGSALFKGMEIVFIGNPFVVKTDNVATSYFEM